MANISKINSLSIQYKQNAKLRMLLLILLAICVYSRPAKAETNIYTFSSDQSIVVRSGGIAGLQKTFSIAGWFHLTVDLDTGVASFEQVDANLADETGLEYGRSLNEIFNMTGLAGTIIDDTTIEFEGKTADGTESDVAILLTFEDGAVRLKGQTTPPPNSADMFFYDINAVVTKKYAGGTGEPNNPYQITTAEDLILLGETPEDYDKHFKLMADIDLGDYAQDQFNFIGEFIPFTGVFDGNDHSISNFHYADGDRSPLSGGLFSMVADSNAQIKNLTLIDPNISGKVHVGPLVGWMQEGAITNCHVIGGCVNAVFPALVTDQIGGLVGLVDRGTITGCTSSCRVNGHNSVGGLVGYAGKTDGGGCFITNCRATGDVTGESLVGGLVGIGPHSIIICSCATGQVVGGWQVGGLVGSSGGGVTGRYVTDCYATGSVAGLHSVGGLIGAHGKIPIARCYAAGQVINLSGEPDTSQDYIGGLIGSENRADSTCFWDIETSGRTTSKGGIGLTTAQMQMASTFLEAGWDFVDETENGTDDIWSICEGTNYPRLVWQIPAGDFVCPDGITIDDFLFFMEHWLDDNCDASNDYCQGTDLDQSGTVDVLDLEIFFENWSAE